MKIRTPKEIAKLPKFSKQKCNSVYKITDDLYIDNVDGYGKIKANSDIRGMGCLTYISVENYMRLACDVENREEVDRITKLITEGYGVACPSLYVHVDPFVQGNNSLCKVAGHEGYNTAVALLELGITALDFQLLFVGYRAKHIESANEFAQWLAKGIVAENGTTIIKDCATRITLG